MVRVNPLTPLRTGERYTITVRALPNLLGRAGSASGGFTRQKADVTMSERSVMAPMLDRRTPK